jgi:hypothetical protein
VRARERRRLALTARPASVNAGNPITFRAGSSIASVRSSLLTDGLTVGQLAGLVFDGFAAASVAHPAVGGREKPVIWVKITEAGEKRDRGIKKKNPAFARDWLWLPMIRTPWWRSPENHLKLHFGQKCGRLHRQTRKGQCSGPGVTAF